MPLEDMTKIDEQQRERPGNHSKAGCSRYDRPRHGRCGDGATVADGGIMNRRPRREEKSLWEAHDRNQNKGRRAGALMQDNSIVEIRSLAHQVELAQSRKVKRFVWMDELPANKQPAEQDAKPEPNHVFNPHSYPINGSGAISCPAVFQIETRR